MRACRNFSCNLLACGSWTSRSTWRFLSSLFVTQAKPQYTGGDAEFRISKIREKKMKYTLMSLPLVMLLVIAGCGGSSDEGSGAKEKMDAAMDSASEAAEEMAEKGGEMVDAAKKEGEEMVDAAKDKGGEMVDAAKKEGEEMLDAAKDTADDVKKDVEEKLND